ncbi:hypothetical protein C8R44DRAFT_865545 [Mycena epipterygia]|nr:hypothetical protein C8R44DRAFT_865545 [Mycena epipterygia]
MASDPENDPRVAQITPGLIPPALAITKAVPEDTTAAALAEIPHVTGAFVNAIHTNNSAVFSSALVKLFTKTVTAAHSGAVKAFVAHTWKQHQSETLAAETAANSDKRFAHVIEALEEHISYLQCELVLKRTAKDLESNLPLKTEEHDEHDRSACLTKWLKIEHA